MVLGEGTALSIALAGAAALVAFVGWRRAGPLAAITGEPRVRRLGRFFVLAGAAFAVDAGQAVLFSGQGDAIERSGAGILDALFLAHHALLLGGLLMAARAVTPPRVRPPSAVLAPFLLVAEPSLRFVEVVLLAYLVVRTALNHAHRASVGSLEVAFGFTLLFAGEARILLDAAPLGTRDPLGMALVVLGFVLLALSVPRGGGRA